MFIPVGAAMDVFQAPMLGFGQSAISHLYLPAFVLAAVASIGGAWAWTIASQRLPRFEVMETAHAVGLRSTATIMFGHVDAYRHWARHLLRVRALQERTGGFTEFVPLPFVHMEAPIYLKGRARQGPTFREAILLHAAARLALHPWITNVQASWVKLGVDGAEAALRAGANDLGGTLMNESISRAAGSVHGQELLPERMEETIAAIGRTPRQRTTLYGDPPPEQVRRSFGAPPLSEPRNPSVNDAGLGAPPRLVRPGFAVAVR